MVKFLLILCIIFFVSSCCFVFTSTHSEVEKRVHLYKKEVKKGNWRAGDKIATPLKIAINNRDVEAVRYLIKNGVDVNEIDKSGYTALGLTAFVDFNTDIREIVERLLDAGADPVNIPSEYSSALYLALSTAKNNDALIDLMIKKSKIDLNRRYESESTLLMRPSLTASTIECLITHGADVNARDKNGYTPLMSHMRKVRIVNGSLKACPSEIIDAVRLFLKHGADINAKSSRNETALDLAMADRSLVGEEVIQFLIQNGAKSGSELPK